MVVAGADVHVVAHAVALAPDDQHVLRVDLDRRVAVDDVHARLLERLRPVDVVRSSKRAFSSTTQTACLPRSAARISAGTSVESSLVRYTVVLSVGDRGSLTAADEALAPRRERVVGVLDDDVAVGDLAEARRPRALVA